MCVADFDPPRFYCETMRRAAKAHDCYDCDRGIARGELYQYVTAMWDRRPDTYRRCGGCVALAEAVEAVECSWLWGSLLDDALTAVAPDSEHWSAPPEAMGRLVGLIFRAREERDERNTARLERARAA